MELDYFWLIFFGFVIIRAIVSAIQQKEGQDDSWPDSAPDSTELENEKEEGEVSNHNRDWSLAEEEKEYQPDSDFLQDEIDDLTDENEYLQFQEESSGQSQPAAEQSEVKEKAGKFTAEISDIDLSDSLEVSRETKVNLRGEKLNQREIRRGIIMKEILSSPRAYRPYLPPHLRE